MNYAGILLNPRITEDQAMKLIREHEEWRMGELKALHARTLAMMAADSDPEHQRIIMQFTAHQMALLAII